MGHVLLIEPDWLLAETYTRALSSDRHTVTPCASAQAAILAADGRLPDLILLELQLIEHSGIEFLYELRSYSEWQTIPVIIHSQVPISEFSGSWQLMQRQLAVVTYLYKPTTSLQKLLKEVNRRIPVPA